MKTDGQSRDKEGEQGRVKTYEEEQSSQWVGKGGSWSRKECGFRASCSHGKDE